MKFLTAKQTENMTLAQFQAAMREGKVEVKQEGSHKPTADQVTMGGRFGSNWFAAFTKLPYTRENIMTIYIVTYDDGLSTNCEKYCDAFATRKEAEAYVQNEAELDREWFEIVEKTLWCQ